MVYWWFDAVRGNLTHMILTGTLSKELPHRANVGRILRIITSYSQLF